MGHGFTLKCTQCDYEQRMLLGMGFLQLQQSMTLMDEMRDGRYGREFAEKADTEAAEADLTRELVVCPACGAFEVVDAVSLFIPAEDIEAERTVLAESEHHCVRCGVTMQRTNDYRSLRCPHCRSMLQASGMILWD